MNKKGLSHVDWVISMGIFVIYVLFMLLFLKPSDQSTFKGESLINIVENNLVKEGYVRVDKIPVLVTLVSLNDGSGNPITIVDSDYNIKIDNFKSDFLESWDGEDNIFVVDSGGNQIPYSLGNDLIVRVVQEGVWNTGTVNEKLFWIYYSSNFSYINALSVGCGPACLVEGINFNISFGASRKSIGFMRDYLTDLCGSGSEQDYKDLKLRWSYPDSREFSYYVVESEEVIYKKTSDNTITECNIGMEPGQQVDIFAKELRDVIIDEHGNRKGIIINIRTW